MVIFRQLAGEKVDAPVPTSRRQASWHNDATSAHKRETGANGGTRAAASTCRIAARRLTARRRRSCG